MSTKFGTTPYTSEVQSSFLPPCRKVKGAMLTLHEGAVVPQIESSTRDSGRLPVELVQNRPNYFEELLAKVVTSNNKSFIKNAIFES